MVLEDDIKWHFSEVCQSAKSNPDTTVMSMAELVIDWVNSKAVLVHDFMSVVDQAVPKIFLEPYVVHLFASKLVMLLLL